MLKRAGAQALLAARQRAPTVRRQACRLACSTWRRLCRLAGGLLALCLALVHDSFSAACQAQHGCSALVAQLVACSTGAILQAHRWAGTCARSLCTAGWLRACDAWSATKRRATRALAAIKRLVAAASRRAAAARGSAVTAWRHGAARARKHSRACAALALALLAAFLLGRYSSGERMQRGAGPASNSACCGFGATESQCAGVPPHLPAPAGNLHLAPGSAMAPAPRHNTWPTLLAPPGNASKAFHAACPQAAATCTAVDATSPPPMGAPWASADGLGNATYADRPLERTPVAADPLPALVLVARATASAALTGTKHATRAAAAELEAAGVALLDWAARSTLLQRTGAECGCLVRLAACSALRRMPTAGSGRGGDECIQRLPISHPTLQAWWQASRWQCSGRRTLCDAAHAPSWSLPRVQAAACSATGCCRCHNTTDSCTLNPHPLDMTPPGATACWP